MSKSINLYNQLANHKLFNKAINFDLKRIKIVLKKLGNPERKLKNVINIIGSDGKYSLLTSLKYFIEANNQTTSAYISPSLRDIRERFWMGSRLLNHNEIKKTIKIIEDQNVNLTIFEVLTVIFVVNAANKDNDYNLIEAGALFAKDSTNIFDFPKIQAVVNINKQHLNFLKKKTLNEVILQKVGFLSHFTNIYIGKQKKNVLSKIKKYLKKNKSNVYYSNDWTLLKVKNQYYYKNISTKIKLNTKYIYSKGLLENLCFAIKIALNLGIKESLIKKTIPKIKFEARIQYLNKGKLTNKIKKDEAILIDGCHSEISAQNLADYLKTLKVPLYGIWSMTKNKDPNRFISKFKGLFKKVIVVPIQNEPASLSNKVLYKIAKRNNFNTELANNFELAIKRISSKQKKIICIFGSLYLCGNVLNKN
tara:strand:+ start:3645 stop:4907 length:1263 start_codon:yes stop_codon:yes gene_type:complete